MATVRHNSLITGQIPLPESRRLQFSWPIATLVLGLVLVPILGLMLWLAFLHRSAANAIVNPSIENRFIAEAYRGPASFLIGNKILDAAKEAGSRFDATQAQLQRTEATFQQAVTSNIDLVSFSPSALQRLRSTVEASELNSKEIVIGNIERRLRLLPEKLNIPETVKLRKIRETTGVISTLQFEAVDKLGNRVNGLSIADITVTDADGVEYPFFTIDQVAAPVDDCSIVVLIDKSGSMAGERLLKLQAALDFLIANCSSSTRLEIIGFDSRVTPLTTFTNDHRVLADALKTIRADGGTEITKALDHALVELGDKLGSRSILLCTDGQDPNLVANMQRIITSCQRSKISINVLGLNDSTLDRTNLASLARQASGLFCVAENPLAISNQMNRIVNSYSKVAYRLFVFNPSRKMDRYRMTLLSNPTTFIDVHP